MVPEDSNLSYAVRAEDPDGDPVSFKLEGSVPEGMSISPDGNFVAAASMNGSNSPPTSPLFNDYGVLQIFRMRGTTLTPVTEEPIGHWCEGIAWNRKSDTLLVQCAEQELQIFRFDGRTLVASGALKVGGVPTGIRIAQP